MGGPLTERKSAPGGLTAPPGCDNTHIMNKLKQPVTEALKKAIAESGLTYSHLERETGVVRASMLRFMRGECYLRLDMADRLADYFGLTVHEPKKKGK